jgi:hypothetical protein
MGLFPVFISGNLFGILCSSVLLPCPNYLSLFPLIWFCISSILSISLMYALLILPLLVFPFIAVKNVISIACIFFPLSQCMYLSLLHIIISS